MKALMLLMLLTGCVRDDLESTPPDVNAVPSTDTHIPSETDTPVVFNPYLDIPSQNFPWHPIFRTTLPSRMCSGLVSFGVSAEDLDGDYDIDLIVPNCNQVHLFEQIRQGRFREHLLDLRASENDDAVNVWIYDVNDDDLPDLLHGGMEGIVIHENLGSLQFAPNTDYGLVRQNNFPSVFNVGYLDEDAYLDMFVGYAGRNFAAAIGGNTQYSLKLEDQFYMGLNNGRFHPLPETGEGWYALHSLSLDDTFLVLNDAGEYGVHESTVYTMDRRTPVPTTLSTFTGNFVEAAMGGFFDYLSPGDEDPELWISDGWRPHALRNVNGVWFERSQSIGINDTGFSWSVIPDDFDLDGLVDTVISVGMPAIDIDLPPHWTEAWDEGVIYHPHHTDGGYGTQHLTHNDVVGVTVADITNDGVRELIVRTNGIDGERSIEIWSMVTADIPRVELRFHRSCIGATVKYAQHTRRFDPYSNTGTFSSGSYTLTFPWEDEEEAQIQLRRTSLTIPIARNQRTERIRCDNAPPQ